MLENKPFFSYTLPTERIAQQPASFSAARSSSKLLHAVISSPDLVEISDLTFSKLPEILRSDDLLLLNNTKVMPARFFVTNQRGGAEIEILLLEKIDRDSDKWTAIGKPLKKARVGDTLQLSEGLIAEVVGRAEDGRTVELMLSCVRSDSSVDDLLLQEGSMPIPPYIRKGKASDKDRELYQTVYADQPGSVAAPTAGLHFTEDLLAEIANKGVDVDFVTLHVGAASFTRVEGGDPDTVVPTEYFSISQKVSDKILAHKAKGKRVIAVGTTTTRALESWARFRQNGDNCEKLTGTSLFLSPGAKFLVVDALITNFHQPETTHLLMVSALIGGENTRKIYEHALADDYRFLSYGDSMFLEKEI